MSSMIGLTAFTIIDNIRMLPITQNQSFSKSLNFPSKIEPIPKNFIKSSLAPMSTTITTEFMKSVARVTNL